MIPTAPQMPMSHGPVRTAAHLPQLMGSVRHFTGPGEDADPAAAEAKRKEQEEVQRKALAAQNDGETPQLSDSEAKLLKEQMATKKKLEDMTRAAEEANARLKAFEGLDPERVKVLIAEADKAEAARKAAEEENLRKAGEWDRLKEMMTQQHKTEVETLMAQINEKATALDSALSTISELTLGAAFSNSSFIQNELVLPSSKARKTYGEYFEIDGKDVVGYDKPRGAANRTMLVNSAGDPLSFDEALKKIVDADPDRDSLLRSKLKAGAGTSTVDISPKPAPGKPNQGAENGVSGLARIQLALEKGALKPKK